MINLSHSAFGLCSEKGQSKKFGFPQGECFNRYILYALLDKTTPKKTDATPAIIYTMGVSFFTDSSLFTKDTMPAMNATNPTKIRLIPITRVKILLREPI